MASSDRNLLFGITALQLEFISRDAMVAAMNAWVLDKSKSLGHILVAQNALSLQRLGLLESLVDEHLKRHGDDPHKSLAAANPGVLPRAQLAALADSDLNNSMARILEKGASTPGWTGATTLAYQPQGRDRYTLSRLHAQGGIGQVWIAHDDDIGRDVALKELIPGRTDSPAAVARFLEEAKITGQLEHPSIVPVYELFDEPAMDGAPSARKSFYTMRFVKGRTLSIAIKEYHGKRAEGSAKALDFRELLGAFVAVCNAAAYAHSRGVIHRDLKGANVVLGDFGEVVVLDWGLAKVHEGAKTASVSGSSSSTPMTAEPGSEEEPSNPPGGTGVAGSRGSITYRDLEPVSVPREASRDVTIQGQVLGTPAYMSPEQAEGRLDLIDQRSDVYSLGAILYEILTGRPPFEAPSAAEILSAVRREEPDRPRRRVPETPPALEAICLKALAKRRDERYVSASDLAQDVQHWLADEPVSAYREPLPVRVGRWARRHRSFVAGATALMVTAIVALSVSTFLIGNEQRRTEQARRLAQKNFEEAEAQRQLAQESFRQARQAVDDYFTKVSESKLLNVPGLQPLRKELLESAREYYWKFLEQRGHDPTLHGELGKAHFRVGLITNDVGSKPQALAAYLKARDLQEAMLRDHPNDAATQSDLAETCWHMGELERWSSQNSDALRSYDRSRELRERLVREHPEVPAYQNALARSYAALGTLYHFTDRPAESVRAYEQARVIGEDLVLKHPDNSQFQRDLADSCRRLGEVQISFEQYAPALSSLQRARELFVKLAGLDPPYTEDQYYLAWTHSKCVTCQHRLGDLPGAVSSSENATGILEKLVRENSSMAEYRNGLATSLLQTGLLKRASGQLAESLQSIGRAADEWKRITRDHPTISVYQLNLVRGLSILARAHVLLGQSADAIRTYDQNGNYLEQLVREQPDVIEYEYELAHSNWLLGLAQLTMGEANEADRRFRQTIDIVENSIRKYPDRARFQNLLAWYLASCPDARLRDGTRAVALAKRAIELAPDVGNFVNTLGVAQYRAGQWREAVTTLEKSIAIRSGGTSEDFYFLAMACWQLNEPELARQWYAKAAEWMSQNDSDDEELNHFRAEAAALIGEEH